MSFFKAKESISSPKQVGFFQKVSFDQYYMDWVKLFGEELCTEEEVKSIWEAIELPTRSTKKSAGYDFVAPYGFELKKGGNVTIPTGVRVLMDDNCFLACFPRSGMGFKSRVALANTSGIIDADYSDAENEGHIFIKLCYDGVEPSARMEKMESEDGKFKFKAIRPEKTKFKELVIEQGDKFVQGIFINYGISEDDNANKERKGGFGSTGK